jgi:hypothetical protein
MKPKNEDMIAALKVIAGIPMTYYTRGPEYCRDEMAKVARAALDGTWTLSGSEDGTNDFRPHFVYALPIES